MSWWFARSYTSPVIFTGEDAEVAERDEVGEGAGSPATSHSLRVIPSRRPRCRGIPDLFSWPRPFLTGFHCARLPPRDADFGPKAKSLEDSTNWLNNWLSRQTLLRACQLIPLCNSRPEKSMCTTLRCTGLLAADEAWTNSGLSSSTPPLSTEQIEIPLFSSA